MKIKIDLYKKIYLELAAFVICFLLAGKIISGMLQFAAVSLLFLLLVIFSILAVMKKRQDAAAIAVIPVFFSAFQNIWLGIVINNIDSKMLNIYLVYNFIFVFFLCFFCIFNRNKINKQERIYIVLFIVLVMQMISMYYIYPARPASFLASFRNFISPMLFLIFGILIGDSKNIEKLLRAFSGIGICVILMGFYEKIINPNIWVQLNIGELWMKKGIRTIVNGVPANFYSSEKIFGSMYFRRMSSSFGDPVNLGTFLLFIFLLSCYTKRRSLSVVSILACLLTVSKGALLGILIYGCVWAFFKDRTKMVSFFVSLIAVFAGITFLQYAKVHSTGSVFLHIAGFFNSFKNLLEYPFGVGCGNIGVMSSVLSISKNADITESGMGAIIGSLGIPGLLIYGFYFLVLIGRAWKIKEVEKKIFIISLVLSILSNILFNEVALSPNSCGAYFISIGIMMKDKVEKNSTIQAVG